MSDNGKYVRDDATSEPTQRAVNVILTANGKLRPVCEFCGKVGRAAEPDARGELSLWDVATGWSEAPYSPGFMHADGSTGSLWTCPTCNARLERGESLPARGGTGTWSRLL